MQNCFLEYQPSFIRFCPILLPLIKIFPLVIVESVDVNITPDKRQVMLHQETVMLLLIKVRIQQNECTVEPQSYEHPREMTGVRKSEMSGTLKIISLPRNIVLFSITFMKNNMQLLITIEHKLANTEAIAL